MLLHELKYTNVLKHFRSGSGQQEDASCQDGILFENIITQSTCQFCQEGESILDRFNMEIEIKELKKLGRGSYYHPKPKGRRNRCEVVKTKDFEEGPLDKADRSLIMEGHSLCKNIGQRRDDITQILSAFAL